MPQDKLCNATLHFYGWVSHRHLIRYYTVVGFPTDYYTVVGVGGETGSLVAEDRGYIKGFSLG